VIVHTGFIYNRAFLCFKPQKRYLLKSVYSWYEIKNPNLYYPH